MSLLPCLYIYVTRLPDPRPSSSPKVMIQTDVFCAFYFVITYFRIFPLVLRFVITYFLSGCSCQPHMIYEIKRNIIISHIGPMWPSFPDISHHLQPTPVDLILFIHTLYKPHAQTISIGSTLKYVNYIRNPINMTPYSYIFTTLYTFLFNFINHNRNSQDKLVFKDISIKSDFIEANDKQVNLRRTFDMLRLV